MHLLSSLSWLAVGAGAVSLNHPSNSKVARTIYGTGNGNVPPKTVGYYGNWDIYGAKYFVNDIPAAQLTHLAYAFANVDNKTGEVILSDTYADLQYAYPGDNTKAPGNNAYGNIKQLYLLKKKYRNLKTTLSVGGWSYRANFAPMLATPVTRDAFVKSAVKLISDLGFDGLDMDYEYVEGQDQADQMVTLLESLRAALDELQTTLKATAPFILSYSSPAGKAHYSQLDFQRMTPYLDFYNFMAVDYMGPGFSNNSGYLDNLYADKKNPNATDFNTASAIHYYLHQAQVPPQKIVLQNPLYGRSFNGTSGIGKPFIDGGSLGSLGSAGTWRYKDLPVPGYNAAVVNNYEVGGSYSYDAEKKYLVAYDTPDMVRVKVAYVKKMKLGGTAWWEVSQDRTDDASLITATINAYGGVNVLEQRQNNLHYPSSQYDNIRNGMN
ncbi:hypothetical protein E4U42_006827 [Claviceps africana]|uniref:chitinase n=1 Tax=Claviceps africana TaxID=83212 RepID=A0A8K0J4Q3_9HYPO|nr:hypothetical protein E4U42_006827 [Claviceps africana]